MYTCIISCHALYMAIYRLLSWSRADWKGENITYLIS